MSLPAPTKPDSPASCSGGPLPGSYLTISLFSWKLYTSHPDRPLGTMKARPPWGGQLVSHDHRPHVNSLVQMLLVNIFLFSQIIARFLGEPLQGAYVSRMKTVSAVAWSCAVPPTRCSAAVHPAWRAVTQQLFLQASGLRVIHCSGHLPSFPPPRPLLFNLQ